MSFKRRVLAIEELSKGVHSKDSRWIELAIKQISRGQKVSRWIELAIEEISRSQKVSIWIEVAIESYRECNKKKLKGLNR